MISRCLMGGSASAQQGDFVQPKAVCPSHSEAKQVKTLGFGAGRGLHLFPFSGRCRDFLWAASLKAQVCPHPGPFGRAVRRPSSRPTPLLPSRDQSRVELRLHNAARPTLGRITVTQPRGGLPSPLLCGAVPRLLFSCFLLPPPKLFKQTCN